MDAVRLKGLMVEVQLGVTEGERAEPQRVELELELRGDLRAAGRADDLAKTVDYAAVVEGVGRAVQGREFRLLEAVAEAAAGAALAAGAAEVVVRARKFAPPVRGVLGLAEVEILRSRQDA
jgi:dihydroneopterin aldolase